MTISQEEARNRGLSQATEWRDRKAVTQAGTRWDNYLEFLCNECLRLSEDGIESEVVHGDKRVDNLVALFREQKKETKSWQKRH